MKTNELLFETPERKIYKTEDEKYWLVEINEPESVTVKSKKKGKNALSQIDCDVAVNMFKYLNSFHVPNYFEKTAEKSKYVARALEQIPIRIVVHNLASGHLVKKFGAEMYQELDSPILEFFKRDKKNSNLMLNEYHALAFNITTLEEFRMMSRIVTKINAILKSFFLRRDLKLVKFACEFGRENGRLTLMSEINMNSCLFFDPSAKPEKDIYNPDNGMLEKAYTNLRNRVLS
jgi:phosphoribosylaminoimidazole-succinocarboxamide synthase